MDIFAVLGVGDLASRVLLSLESIPANLHTKNDEVIINYKHFVYNILWKWINMYIVYTLWERLGLYPCD